MPSKKKMPPKYVKKPKQAVNQFVHSKKSQPSQKPSGEDCENGIEIISKYPMKNGRIIVHEKDMKDVWVQLCITNHFSNSIVFNNLILNKENFPIESTNIPSGENLYYKFHVPFDGPGIDHVQTNLKFQFLNEGDGRNITKKITISAQQQNLEVEFLQPTLPYKRPPDALIRNRNAPKVIYPPPPITKPNLNNLPKIKLDKYPIPDDIRKIVNHGPEEESPSRGGTLKKHREFKEILNNPLTKENYQETFKYLLYLEELQAEVALARFNIESTPMFCHREEDDVIYLKLEIAGIIDSNMFTKYETLCVRFKEEDGTLSPGAYEGNVVKLEVNSILIAFGRELAEIYHDEMLFQVHFYPCRYTFRLQHRALQLVKEYKLWPVLFPDYENVGQRGTNPQKIPKFFNKDIEKNPEQKKAVRNIVSGSSRPCPYIIFGPPGTGKTSTLIEAVKQVISLSPKSRILACAFSNAAADLLAKKLLNFPPQINIFRMYAVSFTSTSIPKNLKPFSNFCPNNDDYFYPTVEKLKTYDVVICTVTTASRLSSRTLMGNFSHIFIDESGFSLEPELLVAISGILDVPNTQLVLAGDHKQLGPVVQSPYATKYKLNVSLLERLMTTFPIYERQPDGTYNQKVITKLLQNYRSHPDILKVSNELFYDNELQACGNEETIYQLCELPILVKPKFPLIIHSIVGEEQREGNCPSYFNAEESVTVVDYIKKLHEHVSPNNIGVITPYCKQVQKINILLQRAKIENVKVNSVEKFLGDERTVIIISTVRSNLADQEDSYTNPMLGFLSNQKRFNVAVTRPKALLIVVGNVKCLSNDRYWFHLFSYCTENGAIKAESLKARDEVIEHISTLHKK